MNITRLDRYIFIQSLIGFIIAISAISVAIILVDLVEQMRAISGIENTSFLTALYFTFIRLPGLVEQTTPITILIAALLTFTGMSRHSEIIAMRAAGVSAWRFLAPLGTLAFGIGVLVVIFVGPLAANLNQSYELQKSKLNNNITITGPNSIKQSWTTMPIKNGQIVVTGIQKLNNANEKYYENGFIIELSQDGKTFIRRIDAKNIIIKSNALIANDCVVSKIGLARENIAQISLEFDKSNAETTNVDAKSLPIWDLPNAAYKAKISGGSPEKFWLRFYRLISLPITMLAIALFAGLMSIGLDRSGGKAKSVFLAICVGMLMFFINDFAGLLATSGQIPAFVAAFLPPIFVLSSTLYFLSIRED